MTLVPLTTEIELERRHYFLDGGRDKLYQITRGEMSHAPDISLLSFLERLKNNEMSDESRYHALGIFADNATGHIRRLMTLPGSYYSMAEGRMAVKAAAATLWELVDYYELELEEIYQYDSDLPSGDRQHRLLDQAMIDIGRTATKMFYAYGKELGRQLKKDIYEIQSRVLNA